MMKNKLAGALGALALMMGVSPASADADELGYYVNVYGTSDYVFRGLSYNDQDPTAQLDIGVTYGNFYGGVFGSMTDYLDLYGPWEFDYYAGWGTQTGAITWDFTAWYYTYGVEDPSIGDGDLNYFEMTGKATINPTDKLTLSLFGAFTPEQKIAITDTQTVEGSAAYTLPQLGMFTPTASALLGYTSSDIDGYWLGEKDYTYWNAGVDFAVDKFDFDFRYWDTTIDNDLADARFVFTASVALP